VTNVADRLDYPGRFVPDLQRLGDETLSLLDSDPDAAKAIAVTQLDLIRRAEAAVAHPLHKGQPLFNIATAESIRSHQAARGWFIAAFIEDVRLDPSRMPDMPAANALTSVYQYDDAGLDGIAAMARQDPAADPVELGHAIADRDASNPLDLPYDDHADEVDLDGFSRGDRVFVGGSYRYESPNVVAIARGVRQAGRHPVVVKTFPDRPGESNRRKSFRFLDMCGSAAFDGSGVIAPGWVNEVEHIAREPIPTLIAFAADQESRDPNLSTMLPGQDEIPELVTRPFTDHRRLPAMVAAWLTERVSREPSPAGGSPFGGVHPDLITASGVGYARDRTRPIRVRRRGVRRSLMRRLGAAGRSATRCSRSSSTRERRSALRNAWRTGSQGPGRSWSRAGTARFARSANPLHLSPRRQKKAPIRRIRLTGIPARALHHLANWTSECCRAHSRQSASRNVT
jgi:hypothetical protein